MQIMTIIMTNLVNKVNIVIKNRRHIFLPVIKLITYYKGIAGNKSIKGNYLPNYITDANGFWYGQDNKLDTLKWHTPRHKSPGRFSLIYRWCLSRVLLVERVANTSLTTSIRFNQCKDLSRKGLINITLLRDLTAYDGLSPVMRGRSLHTRGRVERLLLDSKGDSLKQEVKVTKVLKNKKVSDLTFYEVRKTGKSDALVTLVQKELLLYKDKRGRYNGLINIFKNPEFLVACYENIRGKPGNMTKTDTDKILGELNWFINLGMKLLKGKYDFSPAIRVVMAKAKGKTRPLGINSRTDQIVLKGLTVILEQIWENILLNPSHGFIPKTTVDSTLKELYLEGGNYNWVIKGWSISKCFDSIYHKSIMSIIEKKIKCKRTLELLKKAFSQIYIDPEGTVNYWSTKDSVVMRLLYNIVLHELDTFLYKLKADFESGYLRPALINEKLHNAWRCQKDIAIRKSLFEEIQKLRATDAMDAKFRKLKYVRYEDNFVVLIIGSHQDAINIRSKIKDLLINKCGLKVNDDKIIISNIREKGFKFLGADCSVGNMTKNLDVKLNKIMLTRATRMSINIDLKKVYKYLVSIKVAKWDDNNTPLPRGTANTKLINLSHSAIIAFYNRKVQDLYYYYSFAKNRQKLRVVFWILKSSCALTLAKKFKLKTQGKVFKKYGENLECPITKVQLFKPSTFQAILDYKEKGNTNK